MCDKKLCATCKHKKPPRRELRHNKAVYQQGKKYPIYYCDAKVWNVADCNAACSLYEE